MHARTLLVAALLLASCSPVASPTPPPSVSPQAVSPQATEPPRETDRPAQSPDVTPDASGGGTTTVRAYFFLGSFVDNAGLVPVLRSVPQTQAVGAAAMEALLVGPNDAELGARPAMYTNISDGTRFLGLSIDHGVATVNLSKEFDLVAGSAAAVGRLAQVVYTLTQFPTVNSVSFQIDGVPKPVFGSDGVTFDGPVSRDDYTDQLPAILVDRPAWGGVLGDPARLVGVANVFEAVFRAEILDGDGRSIAATPVTATCGSGCWGAFDVTIRYDVGTAGWGTLRVFEPSAKDGSPTNITEYPVWLTP
jgi:spore germination protein GerM